MDNSETVFNGWEKNDAPRALRASKIPAVLSMMIGIMESVISTSVENMYAYLPMSFESAPPIDLARSSGIVVSVRSMEESTMERNDRA